LCFLYFFLQKVSVIRFRTFIKNFWKKWHLLLLFLFMRLVYNQSHKKTFLLKMPTLNENLSIFFYKGIRYQSTVSLEKVSVIFGSILTAKNIVFKKNIWFKNASFKQKIISKFALIFEMLILQKI